MQNPSDQNNGGQRQVARGGIATIQKVDPAPQPTESSWVPILRAINPMGYLADAYAKTLAYRIETRRLDIELRRISAEAELREQMIDKAFQLNMEFLQQRRLQIVQHYETLRQELSQKHIQRMIVLAMAEKAGNKALDSELGLEERQFSREFYRECMEDVHRFGDAANQALNVLVQALPPIPVAGFLINGE